MKETLAFSPDELRELLAREAFDDLRALCASVHPGVVADALADLAPEEIWSILRHLDLDLRADLFRHLDDDLQVEVALLLTRNDLARLLAELPPDDRADLFKHLPEDKRDDVLPALASAEREDLRRLSSYAEGTAGSVMTSDYATLSPDLTVAEALDHLRLVAPDRETIYYAYVVDDQRRLLGFVSLKDLILAPRSAKVADLMHREVLFARVDDDQEDAARKIQQYDLLALPVINGGDALVGIITHDDALDIITQENTEDMEKLMAISGAHEPAAYLRTPAWLHFKHRATWLVALAALELFSGMVIRGFEHTLSKLMILAFYMPMIADTGGNAGSQSATVIVRALALRELSLRDVLRVLFKELQVSALLALVLAALSYGKVMLLSHGTALPPGFDLPTIAAVIALALGVQVVTATLIGALLPLGATALKLDPAVVASPALTTLVDITGLLIYFTTARLLLNL